MKHHDAGAAFDVTCGYGEKGHYRKISVTLPPDSYERLIQESARRKIAGEPNQLLSALLREAVTEYLNRLDSNSPQPGRS